jgi:hypothetical protein
MRYRLEEKIEQNQHLVINFAKKLDGRIVGDPLKQ